jgi:hypothetical protein
MYRSVPFGLAVSGHVFRHYEDNGDLQQTLRSSKPNVNSVDADNSLAVRLRPAKFSPDAQAVRQ